ncbi:MAG: LacI family DNA-binding transcriptional regulator [Flavobacteriaceae bacterium]
MNNKKHTIKDIANLAGVSKGTVDRVLHNRGKVSEKALKNVEKVLRDIDYQPNPMARNLKHNKIYRIGVLMPNCDEDAYWIQARQGIYDAIKEFKPFGVLVDEFYYSTNEKKSFQQKSEEALSLSPDALLMAPAFQKEADAILDRCKKEKILVALFNNYIDSKQRTIFIGQDLYQSGRVAASLIDKMVGVQANVAIVHVNIEPHMLLKESGFKSYFADKNASLSILSKHFNTLDEAAFRSEVSNFLNENPKLAVIFVTNSKAYKIIDALGTATKNTLVLGYDLLRENINYLKDGRIDFLIHQKPHRQAYLGINYLAEHFLFGKNIPAEVLLPIDIITAENVTYYMD